MMEAFKRAAQVELDNVCDPDFLFAWAVVMASTTGIIVWTMVMS